MDFCSAKYRDIDSFATALNKMDFLFKFLFKFETKTDFWEEKIVALTGSKWPNFLSSIKPLN